MIEQLTDAMQEAPPLAAVDGITFELGDEAVFKQGAPPRVVFTPGVDRYGPPTTPGGSGIQKGPRAFASCAVSIFAHCWGVDLDAAWDLARRVLGAARLVAPGDVMISSGKYELATFSSRGRVYVVEFTIGVPVTFEEEKTAQAQALSLSRRMG